MDEGHELLSEEGDVSSSAASFLQGDISVSGEAANGEASSEETALAPEEAEASRPGRLLLFRAGETLLDDDDSDPVPMVPEREALAELTTQASMKMSVKPPIVVEYAASLAEVVEESHALGRLLQRQWLPQQRAMWRKEWGLSFPPILFTRRPHWPDHKFKVFLHGTPVLVDQIPKDSLFVEASPHDLHANSIPFEETLHPVRRLMAAWCDEAHKPQLDKHEFFYVSCGEYLLLALTGMLLEYAHEFVGVQEVQSLLVQLEKRWPALVRTCLEQLSLPQLRRVLRMLVEERFPLVHLPQVLEILVDMAEHTNDSGEMAEAVRRGLKRHLCYRYAPNYQLLVYLLDEPLESILYPYLVSGQFSRTLALRQDFPGFIHDFLSDVRRHLHRVSVSSPVTPVILTNSQLRRPLQRLVHLDFPMLDVLSYDEVAPQFNVVPLVTLSVDRPTPSSGIPLHYSDEWGQVNTPAYKK